MDIVAVDIGGTNARFAIASVEAGRVLKLGPPLTLKTNAHVGLEAAWAVFAASTEQPLPRKAAIAVAAPVEGDVVKLTNSSWVIRPSQLSQRLGLDQSIVINDFVAVGHAVAPAADGTCSSISGQVRMERGREGEEWGRSLKDR